MFSNEFLDAVRGTRRCGLNRFTIEVCEDVVRKACQCFVTTPTVLAQCLHHDPVEFSLDKNAEALGLGATEGRE